MARFRGTVQGGRGEASRLGHSTSGLEVVAQTYAGDVRVHLSAQEEVNWVTISAAAHGWSGNQPQGTIFSGPIDDLREAIDWWNRRDEIRALLALVGQQREAA